MTDGNGANPAITTAPDQAAAEPGRLRPDVFAAHRRSLTALERRNRRRALTPRAGLDFSSNDYLGLSSSEDLRKAVAHALNQSGLHIGSGGSRLLRGNDRQHEALETEAANFFGAETALFYAGGFSANAALISTLPQRGDLVVHDALIHASAHEGMGLTKAKTQAVPHNDVDAFADAIGTWRKTGGTGTPWIIVESLYSMDGDTAPLDDLATLSREQDAVLIVDEAHATGVFGPQGRGLAAHLEGQDNVITLHTCGKALGVMGGIICAPAIVTDYLINRSRSFIYATASSPLVCAAVRASLMLCRMDQKRRADLQSRINHAGTVLNAKIGFDPSQTQIKPIILGAETAAVTIADDLQAAGFDIRAIRPPTVPEGTSRLRIAITLNVTDADITAMADTLDKSLQRHGLHARKPGTVGPQ